MKVLSTILLLVLLFVIAGCSGMSGSMQMMNIESSIRSATNVIDGAKGLGSRILPQKKAVPGADDQALSTQRKLDEVDSFVSRVNQDSGLSTSQTVMSIRKNLVEAKARLLQVNSARQMGPGSSDDQGAHQRYLDLCMQSLKRDVGEFVRENGDVCGSSNLLSVLQ